MKSRCLIFIVCLALPVFRLMGGADESNAFSLPLQAELRAGYDERRAALIQHFADRVDPTNFETGWLAEVVSKIYLREDLDWVEERLSRIIEEPRGDMFWAWQLIGATFVGRDVLSEDLQARMRDVWRTYKIYRGNTENHWLMYYVTLYLVTQLYPDDPPEMWFTGQTSQHIHNESKEYLYHWMERVVANGHGEYDASHYIGVYLMPLSLLYGWAEDPTMRHRARMMLDYFLLDFAADTHRGLHVGSHSRVDFRQVLEPWRGVSSAVSWFLFGNSEKNPHVYMLYYAVSGNYQPPTVFHAMANDRTNPLVHRERKPGRRLMRYTDAPAPEALKITYHTPSYAVGSNLGGGRRAIQYQGWNVTWAVDDPRDVHNVFFSLHPRAEPFDLAMSFTEMKGHIETMITRSHTTWASPDKWIGGSPHENIHQSLDTVIVLYVIPEGVRFPHAQAFLSRDLREVRQCQESGWWFLDAGTAFLAVYPLGPHELQDDEFSGGQRLRSTQLNSGFVVQVAEAAEFDGLSSFAEAIRSLSLDYNLEPSPTVRFHSLRGQSLEAAFESPLVVDGTPLDLENWPLFGGDFATQKMGTMVVDIHFGPFRRNLDFDNWMVLEQVGEDSP